MRFPATRHRRACAQAPLVALVLTLASLGFAGAAAAQTDVTTSRISGTVNDAKGSALPGTSVEAINQETGHRAGGVADEKGFYRLLDLPIGLYTLRATLDSFAPGEIKDLKLLLGSTPTVNFTLQSASVAESITVTAQAPLVEVTNTTFSNTIEEAQIKSLPVNGRNFTGLALLNPETTVETQRNNIAIGGERGINTSTMVDGVDYNNPFFGGPAGIAEGRAPLSISQESIKEFNVILNGASVEFGRTGAGVVNVITKSGTNLWHGSAFYYNQPKSLISNFADGSKPRDQKKDQYGASLGGPIVKDRFFFYASYDKQNQHFTIPFISDVLNPAVFAKYPALNPGGTSYVQTQNGAIWFGRLDWQINDSQRVLVRGNNPTYDGRNGTFNSQNGTDNGNEKMNAKSFVGSYTGQFGPNFLNDLNLNYLNEDTPRNDLGLNLPAINVNRPSLFYGEVAFLPITSTVKRKEAGDTANYLYKEHSFKAGLDYNDTSIDQIFKGNWRGVYIFKNVNDLIAGKWTQFREFGGLHGLTADQAGQSSFSQKELALFGQDQWYVRPNLTVTAGLRWESLKNPNIAILNPNDRNADGSFNLTGRIPDDNKQFSPRLSISWSPEPKSVVRLSAGRYWSRTPALLFAQTNTSNGYKGTQYQINALTDANGNPIGPGSDPLAPGWGPAFTLAVAPIDLSHATKIPAPQVFTVSPNFKNAHSDRVSIGAERELFAKFAVGIDLTYAEDRNLERLTNLNLAYDGTTAVNGLPHYGRTRPDPFYGQIIEYVSDARSSYRAATLTLRRRYADGFSFFSALTYSKDKDSDSNERNFAGIQAEDVNNLGLNYGYSDRDIRWKWVTGAVWNTPWWGIGLSGGFRHYSGLPFNPVIGFDANGDGVFTDRPTVNGVHLARNSFRQPNFNQLDLRLSKTINLGPGQLTPIVECFNCANAANRSTNNTTYGVGPKPLPDFGVLNQFTLTPRTFQLALRYDF